MTADLLARKASHFALWRPRHMSPPPRLVIGKLKPGNPPVFVDSRSLALQASPKGSDLWEIPVTACALSDGEVYHYWFEVADSNPNKASHPRSCARIPPHGPSIGASWPRWSAHPRLGTLTAIPQA